MIQNLIPRRLFATCFASYKSYDGLPRYHNSDTNFYTVLEIERDASTSKIKEAYFEKSKKLHPDVNKTEEAKQNYKDVREAYDILGDRKKRKDYDGQLRIKVYQEVHRRSMASDYKERKKRGDLKDNDKQKMKDKQFENWGKWDGTEFDELGEKEEKNYEKQHEIWRNIYGREQSDFRKYAYGYNDKRDGAHPDSKQFKDFEEAIWSSSGTKIAKVVCVGSFFLLIFTSLSIAIMEAKEEEKVEEKNELKNKSDFERLFAQENLRSKSQLKNMDRYFGSSSNDKDPK